MGNRLVNHLRYEVLPGSKLKPVSREILHWLADSAPDDTPVAWLSHQTLAELAGCASNYVGRAIKPLFAVGLLAIWVRPGRVPLYLVLPNYRDCAVSVDAMRNHLRRWRKGSATDVTAAIKWMEEFRLFTTPSTDTPQLRSGVGGDDRKPVNSVEPHPTTQSQGTPQQSRHESKGNSKRNPRPKSQPAPASGRAVTGAKPANGGATTKQNSPPVALPLLEPEGEAPVFRSVRLELFDRLGAVDYSRFLSAARFEAVRSSSSRWSPVAIRISRSGMPSSSRCAFSAATLAVWLRSCA